VLTLSLEKRELIEWPIPIRGKYNNNIDFLSQFIIAVIFEQNLDSKLAYQNYIEAADNGSIDAQIRLKSIYTHGDEDMDVPKSDELAFKYHCLAAENTKDVDLVLELADKYESGIGGPRSFKDAVYWYKIAMEKGNPKAIYMLGCISEKGEIGTIEPNIEQAVMYWKKSAELNYIDAYEKLLFCYLRGTGVKKKYQTSQ